MMRPHLLLLSVGCLGTASAFAPTVSSLTNRLPLFVSTAASAVSAAVNGEATSSAASDPETGHANGDGGGPTSIQLNINEQARTVTSVCTSGTLCTLSSHAGIQGAPFGSLVDYVLDDSGHPVLLMNEMSMHTVNIATAARDHAAGAAPAMVTLFVQLGSDSPVGGAAGGKGNHQQDVSRVSLTGTLVKLDAKDNAPDMDVLRLRYSLTHSYADQVLDSPKFALYRLEPAAIYYVGGFGVQATWVDPQDYRLAAPDILAKDAADMLRRLNQPQHGEDLRLTARHVLQIPDEVVKIRVTQVDRLGMDLRVTTQAAAVRRKNKLETNEYRIGFRIPVLSVEDAKSEILKVFQEAWEIGNGYEWDDAGSGEDAEALRIPFVKIAADSLQ